MKLIRKSTWLELAIDLRSSVIRAIWRRVVATMIFALIIAIAYHNGFAVVSQPTLAGLIPGVVLGLLLVFRTNTAYERFWEGCKIWYNLLSASRILCRNIWVIVPVNNSEDLQNKIYNIKLVGILIIAIKLHLRHQTINDHVQQLISQEQYWQLKRVNNAPIRIINWFAEYFGQLFNERADQINIISNRSFIELNRSLDQITMLIGDCQRILETPLPRPYSIHLKHLLLLYCFALPFQFVQALDWFTIPTVGIISFALLGIEDIGVEIENPFGYDINDLPLDRFSQELQAEIETEWLNCEPNLSDITGDSLRK